MLIPNCCFVFSNTHHQVGIRTKEKKGILNPRIRTPACRAAKQREPIYMSRHIVVSAFGFFVAGGPQSEKHVFLYLVVQEGLRGKRSTIQNKEGGEYR
jgi:hypothetical protein